MNFLTEQNNDEIVKPDYVEISFRLQDKLKKRIDKICLYNDETITSVVTKSLRRYFRYEKEGKDIFLPDVEKAGIATSRVIIPRRYYQEIKRREKNFLRRVLTWRVNQVIITSSHYSLKHGTQKMNELNMEGTKHAL